MSHFHSTSLMSILCQVNQQRDIPALTDNSSLPGNHLHASGVCWQLSRGIDRRKISGVTRQQEERWQPWNSCTGCPAKLAVHAQVTEVGSTAPAEDMRYKLVVQAFAIASHNSVPPALPARQYRRPSWICCSSKLRLPELT